MGYSPKVVLALPLSAAEMLEPFVEACLADGVEIVCVVGPGADEIEGAIDWLVVGDGSDRDRFIMTTAHPDEPLEEVMGFAEGGIGDHNRLGEAAQLVRL